MIGAKPLSEPLLIYWTSRNECQWNLYKISNIFIHEDVFENVVCEMGAILSRPENVKAALLCLTVILRF